ncbi:uracil-DNA glycosylase family protein [Paraburkholderia phymatum]|uniref:Type-4 uracil-DNA glycosylase n=1 Tax=Paraburkholderia phymatum (strain DSM 17167 / CIP 108236 / LMG 21445 / STM815) TaxID=391038 RepID=B2JIF1_PARP8|nr:uracil-DNA glycosylase [Paraburkholderia phymatum]ACC70545.1 phage SPO1 DNA polymerase-related protein [Paraburkholderia phymatum STM815]
MALHESALEELGLAPMWVRRAGAPDAAVDAQASHGDGEVAANVARAAPVASTADAQRPGDDAAVSGEAQSDSRFSNATSEPAASPESARAEVEAAPGGARQSRRASPPPAPDEAPPFPDDDFAWFDDLPAGPPSDLEANTSEPVQPGIDTLDWAALEARVSACERCRLCERRTNTVFGVGDREADWMLIGEAPGENEDKQGEPFVGQAGKLLDNMLRSLGLARGTNVYIANVIKCRPPGNRNPERDEVARCEPYLQRQVALVKPKLIIALGRFAAQSLLKTEASISSLRGRVYEYEGVPVVVTYHPAYLLRSLGDKAKSWQDLCLARDMWHKASTEGDAAT